MTWQKYLDEIEARCGAAMNRELDWTEREAVTFAGKALTDLPSLLRAVRNLIDDIEHDYRCEMNGSGCPKCGQWYPGCYNIECRECGVKIVWGETCNCTRDQRIAQAFEEVGDE